jgi:hypothetical protein
MSRARHFQLAAFIERQPAVARSREHFGSHD